MALGVAVIGAGTVGGGVVKTLLENTDVIARNAGVDVRLTHVCELDPHALDQFDLRDVTVTPDASKINKAKDVHVVCELIGGLEPAKTFILDALHAGKHVVTANKMLLATYGPELAKAARDNKVELRYEAAVAGGIPIIKALREGLAANRISFIYGILNGTCNYILTRMTYEGLDFDDVLAQAMEQGFAEKPPDLDIQGHDTAHKAQILASLCYHTEIDIDAISVEGITSVTHDDVAYARQLGYLVKLLAVIREVDGEVDVRVHPTLVPETHLLAAVRYEFNAIYVQGDVADATLYYGRGAGRMPTASAVVADIVDIARCKGAPTTLPFRYGEKKPLRDLGKLELPFYLRLNTADVPGVLGKVGTILGNHGVSIASFFQEDPHGQDHVHLVMMTHETVESNLRAALAEIDGLDFVREATHVLRVIQE